MGCAQSAPAKEPAENIPRAAATDQSANTSGQKGTPFVTKQKYRKDPVVMMCPYFKVLPDQLDAWKKNCDAFYNAAQAANELIFYGMAFNDGGVHIQQGFASADSLLAHLRKADPPMTEALKNSTLEKVEVYGARRQLRKVKKNMTAIGDVMFQFFETHPKIHGVRRPTEFSGKPGSDKLVTCHVSIEAEKVKTVRTLRSKIKSVHRRTMDIHGSESFFVAHCEEQKTVKLVSTYDNMDAMMEHLSCVVSHLSVEAVCGMHIHGPEAEMDKLKSLTGKSSGGAGAGGADGTGAGGADGAGAGGADGAGADGAGAGGADSAGADGAGDGTSMLKAALEAAAKKAAEDAKHALACSQASAKVVADGVSDAVKAARDGMAEIVEALQKKAEEMAQEVYKNAMEAAKEAGEAKAAAESAANELAEKAHKRFMDAVNDMRRASDEEATTAYEAGMAAGATLEDALERAVKAAEAGAREALDDLREAAEDAEEECKKAAAEVEAAAEAARADAQAVAKRANQEWEACKFTVQIGCEAVEAQCSDKAKEARKAMLSMYDAMKKSAQDVVDEVYAKEKQANEVAEATLTSVQDKARAAMWAVVIAGEHAYLIAVEKELAVGKDLEKAKEAAINAAEDGVSKAHELWRESKDLANEAVTRSEAMVREGETAVTSVWSCTVMYTLDTTNAIRRTIIMGKEVVVEEIQEATEAIAYTEAEVVEDVTEDLNSARSFVLDRIRQWHERLVDMQVDALRAVAQGATAKADHIETKRKVCC